MPLVSVLQCSHIQDLPKVSAGWKALTGQSLTTIIDAMGNDPTSTSSTQSVYTLMGSMCPQRHVFLSLAIQLDELVHARELCDLFQGAFVLDKNADLLVLSGTLLQFKNLCQSCNTDYGDEIRKVL